MLDGADKFLGRFTRELRVGIERDDVTHRFEKIEMHRFVQSKIRVRFAPQESVKFVQISAFTFRANPFAFTLVPSPSPCEKHKAPGVFFCLVFAIEFRDCLPRRRTKLRVGRHNFVARVRQIAKQSEEKFLVTIGEVINFQISTEFGNRCLIGQQSRNDDDSSRYFGNAVPQIHLRQKFRFENGVDQPVDENYRQFACRNDCQQNGKNQCCNGNIRRLNGGIKKRGKKNKGQRDNCRQVKNRRMSAQKTRDALVQVWRTITRIFEFSQTFVGIQIIADVIFARIIWLPGGKLDGAPRHHLLVRIGAFGDAFDIVAIAIAGRKIHPAVCASRVFAQNAVNTADALEKIAPVERRQQTHAPDDVGNGRVHCSLAIMFAVREMFERHAFGTQALL